MSLRRLQEELAALLLEEPARRAFAEAPRRYAGRALEGKEAALLASLDPGDVGYFAERRAIDRRAALRLDLPRTAAHLEASGALLRYFRAFPYALEDPLKETARVARWARGAARQRHVPAALADVARYEAAHLALRARAPRAAPPSARPRRAPGVRLLALGHDLGAVLEDGAPLEAAARPCFVVLFRGAESVAAGEAEEVAFQVLRAADGRRTEAQVLALAARRAGVPRSAAAKSSRELRRAGLLTPTIPRRR